MCAVVHVNVRRMQGIPPFSFSGVIVFVHVFVGTPPLRLLPPLQVMLRHQNAHALVNAAFVWQLSGTAVVSARAFFGAVGRELFRAVGVETALTGNLLNQVRFAGLFMCARCSLMFTLFSVGCACVLAVHCGAERVCVRAVYFLAKRGCLRPPPH